MSDQQTNEAHHLAVEKSLGEILKQAREAKGFSLEQVAKQLSLNVSIIQAIEQNQLIQSHLSPTYMRGYVRNYANFLSIPEEVWNNDTIAYGANEQNDLNKNTRTIRRVNHYSSHSRWLALLTWIVVLAILGITVLWWWQTYQSNAKEREEMVGGFLSTEPSIALEPVNLENLATATSEQNVTTQPMALSSNLEPIEMEILPQTSANNHDVQDNSVVPHLNKTTSQDNGEQVDSPINPIANLTTELQIEVIQASCWISVRDKNRHILAEKEYQKGEILKFNAGSPYSLIIGAPKNVKITYRGKEVSLKLDGRVAKFTLASE